VEGALLCASTQQALTAHGVASEESKRDDKDGQSDVGCKTSTLSRGDYLYGSCRVEDRSRQKSRQYFLAN
jgi:hypothetical protein